MRYAFISTHFIATEVRHRVNICEKSFMGKRYEGRKSGWCFLLVNSIKAIGIYHSFRDLIVTMRVPFKNSDMICWKNGNSSWVNFNQANINQIKIILVEDLIRLKFSFVCFLEYIKQSLVFIISIFHNQKKVWFYKKSLLNDIKMNTLIGIL